MIYEKQMELSQLSYQSWVSNELFSFGWFLMIGVLAVFYTVWLIILDKKRAVPLLLIGALAAVWFSALNMLVIGFLGLTEYKITLTPVDPEIFTGAVTLALPAVFARRHPSGPPGHELFLWLPDRVCERPDHTSGLPLDRRDAEAARGGLTYTWRALRLIKTFMPMISFA